MTMELDWPVMLQGILLLGLMAALALSIPMFVGVYVYYDAKRRGMNAVAWTLAAVLHWRGLSFICWCGQDGPT